MAAPQVAVFKAHEYHFLNDQPFASVNDTTNFGIARTQSVREVHSSCGRRQQRRTRRLSSSFTMSIAWERRLSWEVSGWLQSRVYPGTQLCSKGQ